MTDTASPPDPAFVQLSSAPPDDAKRLGKVETDMFCSRCLYNLYGLDVTRDPNLDLPVVRCPECGKFHAAGMATGAGRVWLNRLAKLLITLWVFFLLGVVVVAGFSFFIMLAIEYEAFLARTYIGGAWMGAGGAMPSYIIRPVGPDEFGSVYAYVFVRSLVAAISIFLGWCFGACFPVFLWHVRRRRFFLFALLVPLLVCIATQQLYMIDLYSSASPEGTWFVFMATLRQGILISVGIIGGIYFGRRIVRLLLYVVLTRKLLQYVRFLWEVDGKTPPALHPDAGLSTTPAQPPSR